MRPRLEAGALALLIVAGCAPAASPGATGPALRSVSPTQTAILPTQAPTMPSPTPSPAPRRSLEPAGQLAWDPLETDGGELRSITAALGFAGTYLVVGSDADGIVQVARSSDGRHWETTPIGSMVEPCSGWVARPDSSVYAAATDGMRVVLAGVEFAQDVSPCDTEQAAAWVSADGQSWQRSTGFGAATQSHFSQATAVRAIPGGWEALVPTLLETGADGPLSIWRSVDALQWRQVQVLDPNGWEGLSVAIGSSVGGTRLRALFNDQLGSVDAIDGLRPGESRLESSIDGVQWTSVSLTLPVGRGVQAGGIVGPGPAGPATWLLVSAAEEGDPMTTYSSVDLQRWEQGTFPRQRIGGLAFTRYGFMATGSSACPAGSGCQPEPAQYLSTDGLHWTPFATSAGDVEIVDGPVGVLAVSRWGFEVWRLRS